MNTSLLLTTPGAADLAVASDADVQHVRRPVATRFGALVDVRNRGSLRLARSPARQHPALETPAVVRLWNGEQCRELNVHDARSLAAQLNEAAAFADQQNRR